MQAEEEYQNKRLDHLGIVAGMCQEIGLVEWLDREAGSGCVENESLPQAKDVLSLWSRRVILT